MQIIPTNKVSFKYSHIIKTYWRKGLLPVKFGLYGGRLTQDTVSLEHLVPKAKQGRTHFANVALATKRNNSIRGSAPICEHLTSEQAERYLAQFQGVKLPDFDGDKYIRAIRRTLSRLGVLTKG